MKTALILCPSYTRGLSPPLGLAYLSSVLKRGGHEVFPFDIDFLLNFENKRLADEIHNYTNVAYDAVDKINFIANPNLVFQSLFASKKEMEANLSVNEIRLIRSARYFSKKYVEKLLQYNLDSFFFSTYIGNLWFSLLMAQNLKEKDRNIRIVFGGPGCGLHEIQEIILRFGFIDLCVVGEGEETVIQMSKSLENEKELKNIPGISMIVNDTICYNPRNFIKNLDCLPYPDFDDLPYPGSNIRHYKLLHSISSGRGLLQLGAIPISASRGCINQCAFCSESAYWNGFRYRSVKSVINEIKHQMKKYHSFSFGFCDSLLNFSPIWIEQFCDAISREKIKVEFVYSFFRLKGIPLKLLKKLGSAGFRFISYGMESGSQKVLQLMRKNTDINVMKQILINTSRSRILYHPTIIGGFPGEKRQDVMNTIKFMIGIENSILNKIEDIGYLPYWNCVAARLEPYSYMYNSLQEFMINLSLYKIQIPARIKHLEPYISKILFTWRNKTELKELGLRMQLIRRYTPTLYKDLFWYRPFILKKLVSHILDTSKFKLGRQYQLNAHKKGTYVLKRNNIKISNYQDSTLFILSKFQLGFSIKEIYQKLINKYDNPQSVKSEIIETTAKLLMDGIIQFNTSSDMFGKIMQSKNK